MPEFFTEYHKLDDVPGYGIFGAVHIGWLLASALMIFLLCLWFRRLKPESRRLTEKIIGCSMVVLEALKILILYLDGSMDVSYLPLHLCGISIFICAFRAFFPIKTASELMYCVCMPGALMALLFPNWIEIYPFFNYFNLYSILIHVLIVAMPLMLVCAGDIKPNVRNLWKCALVLLAFALLIHPINLKFSTNFMFTVRPSAGSPLEWFEKLWGNPGYLLGFPICAAVLWTVMYLPFSLKSKKNKE